MKTNIKRNAGFTLIELLVVIVIIGILSTISVGTFKSFFGKARDAARKAAVASIALMIKADSAHNADVDIYVYEDETVLTDMLELDGFRLPKAESGICYVIGGGKGVNKDLGIDNQFIVATIGESTSTLAPTYAGLIMDGTKAPMAKLLSSVPGAGKAPDTTITAETIMAFAACTTAKPTMATSSNLALGLEEKIYFIGTNGKITSASSS